MKGKLRVEFIKSLGFMFAIGDEYEHPSGIVKVESSVELSMVDAEVFDWNNRFITHFEDRPMTNGQFTEGLVKLPSDFPVIVYCSEDKGWFTGKKNDFWFGKTDTDSTITKWKPDYDKLLEMQNTKDLIVTRAESLSGIILEQLRSYSGISETEGTILSSPEQPTSGSINWADDAQYALVGKGGETILFKTEPAEFSLFNRKFYLYRGVEYSMEAYILVKREEKEQMKLTSNDIDWEEGMKYKVVRNNNNTYTAKQYDVEPKKSLSRLGDDMYDFDGHMYNSDYYYIVKREQEQMEELLFTKEMKDKGELPKAGMKCEYYGDKCDVIGTTTGNMIVIENHCGGIIVCSLDNIKPLETEQDRTDKLKSDQRKEVYDIVHGKLGHLLSPLHYTCIDDAVKELQDSGLLASVSDSNKS